MPNVMHIPESGCGQDDMVHVNATLYNQAHVKITTGGTTIVDQDFFGEYHKTLPGDVEYEVTIAADDWDTYHSSPGPCYVRPTTTVPNSTTTVPNSTTTVPESTTTTVEATTTTEGTTTTSTSIVESTSSTMESTTTTSEPEQSTTSTSNSSTTTIPGQLIPPARSDDTTTTSIVSQPTGSLPMTGPAEIAGTAILGTVAIMMGLLARRFRHR